MANKQIDIAVIGAGLVGLSAALALSKTGKSVVVIAPNLDRIDERTTAILNQSVSFFEGLGVWDDLSSSARPLRTMRIIDALDRLIKAPQVDFNSNEIDLDAFGYNIQNSDLIKLLSEKLEETSVEIIDATVETIDFEASSVQIKTSTGDSVSCNLAIGADGANSIVRNAAGIGVSTTQYPQTALVTNLNHTLPHGDVSTEFHTPSGPFTLVPLTGNSSSLVWVETPERAAELAQMAIDDLARLIETKMQSFLGKISVTKPAQTFPLVSKLAKALGQGRMCLVGEAGHVFPPIGAQGFNLGVRDIVEVVNLVQSMPMDQWSNFGDQYNLKRKADVATRTAAVDALNRSLLSGILPMQLGRSLGLYMLGTVGPMRRFAMREGMMPGTQGSHIRQKLSSFTNRPS